MTQINEMELLKEIPGYKAILKSVIKTQIQILVEQLCEQGGEESIILTASINDGTLSHLGSSMGKGFFEGRDEIKSQFLGYCIKNYHSQEVPQSRTSFQKNFPSQRDQLGASTPKRQKFQQSPVTSLKQEFEDQDMPNFSTPASQPAMSPRIDKVKAVHRKPTPHPPGKNIKTPVSTPTHADSNVPSSEATAGAAAVKVEDTSDIHGHDSDYMPMADDAAPVTDDTTALTNIKQKVSLPSSVNLSHTQTFDTTDENGRSSTTGNMSETVQFEDPGQEATIKEEADELAVSGVGMSEQATGTPSDWDQDESGESDWGQNVSGEFGYQGLPGEDSMDQSGSRYHRPLGVKIVEKNGTLHLEQEASLEVRPSRAVFPCVYCHKTFPFKSRLNRHIKVHTGEKDFKCPICENLYARKEHLQRHIKKIHGTGEGEN